VLIGVFSDIICQVCKLACANPQLALVAEGACRQLLQLLFQSDLSRQRDEKLTGLDAREARHNFF
jgi:hypothetical protein